MPITLQPLAPVHHEFAGPQGASRNDYFFVDAPQRGDAAFQAALRQQVDAAHAAAGGAYALFSVYVYQRTDVLNAGFKGDADALRGVHDTKLVSYARWTQGQPDIFYLIDDGKVVFDLLKNQPVSPAFEFD